MKTSSYFMLTAAILVTMLVLPACGGGGAKTTTSSQPPTTTTTTPPTTSMATTTTTGTTTTTTGTTTTTTGTTTTTNTLTTPPPSTYKLLPGQTILKTASSKIAQPMLHLIAGFEGCVSCHWPGKPGAMDPKNGVLHLVTPSHHCDECHPGGYGLPPWIGEWERELMVKSKVTDEETDTSCTVKNCHQPPKS